jgi:hypothetical protein
LDRTIERALSTNAEKSFGFSDADRLAEKLEGDSTVALFQDNSKQTKVVTFESPKNIRFCLANEVSFKPSRFETNF